MGYSEAKPNHVEGRWEDLISQPGAFAGKRVRITVLPDEVMNLKSGHDGVRQWLDEGKAIEVTSLLSGSVAFSDGLAEKFRKQGLVI